MRKLLLTLMIFLSCVFISEEVHAEEYEYKIYGQVLYTSTGNGYQYYTLEYDIVYNLSYKIAAVASYSSGASKWTFAIIYLDENGNDVRQTLLTKFNCSKYYTKRTKYDDSARTVVGWSDSPYNMEFSVGSNYKYEIVNMSISIPIFESQDDAVAFLNGELTEKDAINYESDLCKVKYDLEIPQDLKITGFSGDEFNLDFAKIKDINYKFKWSQSDAEHSKWTTQFYCYEDFRYRLEGFFATVGEWMYKDDYYLFYDDTDTYRCYWNDYFKKLAEGYVKKEETFGDYDYEILCTKVFIRNAWYDSDEGIQHYSNWIKVDIDFTSGEVTTSFIELGGSEVEKDEDTGSLVIPEDNIIVDSDYTGSDYNGLMIQSSTDLVGWIKNGFGLTGENGVIVLMSETFSFIPTELWYVFLTGISMFVLIAVVKWVRG